MKSSDNDFLLKVVLNAAALTLVSLLFLALGYAVFMQHVSPFFHLSTLLQEIEPYATLSAAKQLFLWYRNHFLSELPTIATIVIALSALWLWGVIAHFILRDGLNPSLLSSQPWLRRFFIFSSGFVVIPLALILFSILPKHDYYFYLSLWGSASIAYTFLAWLSFPEQRTNYFLFLHTTLAGASFVSLIFLCNILDLFTHTPGLRLPLNLFFFWLPLCYIARRSTLCYSPPTAPYKPLYKESSYTIDQELQSKEPPQSHLTAFTMPPPDPRVIYAALTQSMESYTKKAKLNCSPEEASQEEIRTQIAALMQQQSNEDEK